jgi:hypothetical protein
MLLAGALAGLLSPMPLAPEPVARVLTAAGGKAITIDMVQAATDVGAPVGVGGRMNLVELMAWLERELTQTWGSTCDSFPWASWPGCGTQRAWARSLSNPACVGTSSSPGCAWAMAGNETASQVPVHARWSKW